MEFIRRSLFENPVYVYVFLGVCCLVLLAIWHERRDKRMLAWLAAPAGLAAAVWLVATLVVTDREEIQLALRAIAKDVAAGKTDAVEQYLADDFTGHYEGGKIDKKTAVMLVKLRSEALKISEIAVTNFEATISGDTADVSATTRIVYDAGAGGKQGSMIFIAWQFRWTRGPARWVLNESLKNPEPTVPTAN